MITPSGNPAATFDTTTPFTVNDASNFVLIETFKLYSVFRTGLLELLVGAGGALAALKISRCAKDGAHVDWYSNTDFATASADFPSTTPAAIHTLAANASGIIRLGNLDGVDELKIYAKKASADTTVRMHGAFHTR